MTRADGVIVPSRRSILNLASNLLFFLINSLVALWLVRFLIDQLGVEAYGFVPLVVTIASYMHVVTSGINMSIARHLTVSLYDSENIAAKVKTFSTALFSSIASGLVMCFFAVAATPFLEKGITVPEGSVDGARWLFFLTMLSVAVTTGSTTHQAVVYAHNRFDLQNIGNLMGLALRVAALLIGFSAFEPGLWQVGASLLVSSGAVWACNWAASKRLEPSLKAKREYFSKRLLLDMSGTSAWVFVNQIGTILLVNIDLVVANRFIGPYAGGVYASAIQWSILIRNLGLTINGTLGPAITSLYATGKINALTELLNRSILYMGLFIALPVGFLCANSEALFKAWLGDGMASHHTLLIFLLFHLAVNLAYLPLQHVAVAANRVKWPGLSQIVAGIANLCLAIYLATTFGESGIAVAGGIVLLCRNIIFTPIYTAKILGLSMTTFHKPASRIVALTLLSVATSSLSSHIYKPHSVFDLLAVGTLSMLLYVTIALIFFVSKEERSDLLGKVNSIRGKVVS